MGRSRKIQLQWLTLVLQIGNHDITLDETFYAENGQFFHNKNPQSSLDCRNLLLNSASITYLNHEATTVCLPAICSSPSATFKVFGSPYSPAHGLWAFGYKSSEAASLWSDIPLDADIVVTHTPPRGHCDSGPVSGFIGEGCEGLRDVLWRVRPKLMVCGHKHHGRGVERVRWRLESAMPSATSLVTEVLPWQDPGAGQGNKKESKIDLTVKGGGPLDNRADRNETCIVNASYMATNYGHQKRFNKPIVIDLDLPVCQDIGS